MVSQRHTDTDEDNRYDDSEMLWLACYGQNPLLQAQPLLLLLIQHYAAKHKWLPAQRIKVCMLSSADALLQCIDLPATEKLHGVLRHVNDIGSRFYLVHFALSELAALYRAFQNGSLDTVPECAIPKPIEPFMEMAKLLSKHPELADARFIKRSQRNSLCFDLAGFKISRIKDAAKRLNVTDIDKKLRRCRHLKDLNLLRQRLEDQSSEGMLAALKSIDIDDLDSVVEICKRYLNQHECDEIEDHWFDRYQPAPLANSNSIIQLSSFQALFLESHQQHNCADTYRCDVNTGEYALFQVLAPERATLGLKWNQKKQRFQLDQLLLQNNQPVAASTRCEVKRWLKTAQQGNCKTADLP